MEEFGKKRDLKYVTYAKNKIAPKADPKAIKAPGANKMKPAKSSFSRFKRTLLTILMVGVVCALGVVGFLGYKAWRAAAAIIVTNKNSASGLVNNPDGSTTATELPILNWEKKKQRINILLLGIDRRPEELPEYTRTDTMMLVSINPVDNTVALLSIPRDLQVPWKQGTTTIYDRINTIAIYGYDKKDKSTGPAAAKQIVSQVLGVPVQYFVRIDFMGFKRLIDTIGGITVNVPKEVYDDAYPTDNYKTIKIDIKPGVQVMDGTKALQYARSRHGSNDVDRAGRQQIVIASAKDKIVASKWSLVTDPVKLSALLDTVKDNLLTDIQINEMVELAKLVKNIDTSDSTKVANWVLQEPLIYHKDVPSGAWLYFATDPTFTQIHQAVADYLADPNLQANLDKEKTDIRIENGTTSTGVSSQVSLSLRQDYHLQVEKAISADNTNYSQTVIYDISNGGYPKTVAFLENYFGVKATIPENRIPGETANVEVIIGADFLKSDRYATLKK